MKTVKDTPSESAAPIGFVLPSVLRTAVLF